MVCSSAGAAGLSAVDAADVAAGAAASHSLDMRMGHNPTKSVVRVGVNSMCVYLCVW